MFRFWLAYYVMQVMFVQMIQSEMRVQLFMFEVGIDDSLFPLAECYSPMFLNELSKWLTIKKK